MAVIVELHHAIGIWLEPHAIRIELARTVRGAFDRLDRLLFFFLALVLFLFFLFRLFLLRLHLGRRIRRATGTAHASSHFPILPHLLGGGLRAGVLGRVDRCRQHCDSDDAERETSEDRSVP